jgi:hypothetical protein
LLKIVFKPFLSDTYIINQKHDKIFIVAQSRTVRHISIYKMSAIFKNRFPTYFHRLVLFLFLAQSLV